LGHKGHSVGEVLLAKGVEKGTLMTREDSVRMNPETLTGTLTATLTATRGTAAMRTAGIVIAGSAFIAACAHIVLSLNFTPVPLTLQTFAVLVLGLMLSPRLAAGTVAAYLVEGALGLPVFSPAPAMMGGMAHLLGPTGGYLLSSPVAAAAVSWLWRRLGTNGANFAMAAVSAAAGTVVMLGSGGLWLAALTHASAQTILTLGVIPFLPGEALKIAAAAGVTFGYRRFIRRAQ
jgi:biotin transport system substrate-specific component